MGKLIQKTANTSHPYTLPSRTKAITQPKTCQRVWLPKCTDSKQRIKHENTTSCIVHLADSAKFEGVTPNKLSNGLTGSCFESPNDTIHVTGGNK
jgi:hypothetical protein